MTSIKLMNNTGVTSNGVAKTGQAGQYLCRMDGTFNGATIKLQMLSPDGSSWLDIPDASLLAEGAFLLQLPQELALKAVVTGGPPSGMYVTLDYAGA